LLARSSPKGTVLVVDDDEGALESVGELLEHSGYRVLLAAGGEEALARLREAGRLPDMILLDLMMAGMDGWQVVRELRADATLREVPVVIMSAGGGAVLATAPVAEAYVSKPLDASKLLHLVERTLTLTAIQKRPRMSSGIRRRDGDLSAEPEEEVRRRIRR